MDDTLDFSNLLAAKARRLSSGLSVNYVVLKFNNVKNCLYKTLR